jgi:catechol 2,3-dioxygenase-like lactoylglutathione lyase family enzyme
MNELEFLQIRAVSLAVVDASRARQFYAETLGLEADDNIDLAFKIGEVLILLKPEEEWYGKPTDELNARVTIRVRDSYVAERILRERGVTVSDPVAVYGENPIGAFLDSEGNKLWFCSDSKLD